MKKILTLLVLIISANIGAVAQGCSTCTATANNLDAASAKGLNAGIVYLALTPLLFLGVLGFIWYRKYKAIKY